MKYLDLKKVEKPDWLWALSWNNYIPCLPSAWDKPFIFTFSHFTCPGSVFTYKVWKRIIFKCPFVNKGSSLLASLSFFLIMRAFLTAQKIRFSIKDFSMNITKSAGNCGFGHIYWRNLNGKHHFLWSVFLLVIKAFHVSVALLLISTSQVGSPYRI